MLYFETHGDNHLFLKLTIIFILKLTAMVLFLKLTAIVSFAGQNSGSKTVERASVAKKTTTAAMTENYIRRKRSRTAT